MSCKKILNYKKKPLGFTRKKPISKKIKSNQIEKQ